MNRTTMDLWVGVFVAIGVAALMFLSLKAGNFAGVKIKNPYTITADFSNIGGLKVRAPVKVAGVVVGRVDSVSLGKDDYHALVSLKIDSNYEFSKDTYFTVNTSGLLGEQYIGVMPGDPEVAGGILKNNDKTNKTQSAIVLEELIGKLLFSKAEEGSSK